MNVGAPGVLALVFPDRASRRFKGEKAARGKIEETNFYAVMYREKWIEEVIYLWP